MTVTLKVMEGDRPVRAMSLFDAPSLTGLIKRGRSLLMYGNDSSSVVAPVVATATTAGVLTLPNTGGNLVVTLAASVATGLLAWGVLYSRSAN